MYQKENAQKPPAKVKRTKEEMQITFENRKKDVANFSISVLKRKNIVEEGGALGSRVRREQESINLKA